MSAQASSSNSAEEKQKVPGVLHLGGMGLKAFQDYMRAKHNESAESDSSYEESQDDTFNPVRAEILRKYIQYSTAKDKEAEPALGTFKYVVEFLEGKAETINMAAELDFFISAKNAAAVKAAKVPPLVYAKALFKHLRILPAIKEVLTPKSE